MPAIKIDKCERKEEERKLFSFSVRPVEICKRN